MIKFRYRPNIFKRKSDIVCDFVYKPDMTVFDYIALFFATHSQIKQPPLKKIKVIILSKVLADLNITPKEDDEIIVMPKIKEPISFSFFIFGYTIFVEINLFIVAAIGLMAYSMFSAMNARRNTPSFGNIGSGLDDSSPTYGWEGVRTIQEVGTPVKIVYGEHRTGGNIINQYISTDGDRQYLNLLIGLCEGEIESISDIKINEMPSGNFTGIDVATKMGTNTQDVISYFEDLHNLYPINVNLVKDDPYIYTTIDNDIEVFEINLTLPSGLFQVNESNGAVESWDVVYNIQYKVHSDPSYIDLGNTTISGVTRTTLRRVFRKEGLSPNQYDVKITRISADSSLSPQKTGDLTLSSIDEIKTDDLRYPNTALAGIRALGTDQLSGSTPNFTFLVKGKKVRVPDVLDGIGGSSVGWEDYYYDPIAEKFKLFSNDSILYWDEISYTTVWSANPIWCLRDLLTNTRYGMGEHIEAENLDDDELLEMALYCEEKISDGEGGFEKRFRMDIVIDSATKAPDLLTQVSSTFRAFAFYSNNGFSFRIDKPEDPVQVFGMGNIVKGSFTQNWKSSGEYYNLIQVQFNDKDTNYENETISIADEDALLAGDPIKSKDLRLFIAKKSYAIREARYALWLAKYISRTIQIKCGIDAIACKSGDVINVAHDVPQWGFSGRVKSGSTETSINLDLPITLDAGKTYKIMIRFSDDVIEDRYISSPAGTYTTIEVVGDPFSKSPESYDVFSVGEVNKVVKPFRVMGITRDKDGEASITAVEYNASVYSDEGIVLPTSNYSSLSYDIPDVTDLKLTERLVKSKDGTIETAIDVWFNKPSVSGTSVRRYIKAKIYLSDNGGNSWTERGETTGTHFQILGGIIDLLTYKIAVVSIGDIDDENPIIGSPQADITVVGKTTLPSDVPSFIVNQSRDRLIFSWANVDDVDLDGYEIRYGLSWAAGTVLTNRIKGNKYIALDFRVGTFDYWIKAVDTSGNYSENATQATITVNNIPFTNVVVSYDEQPSWTGDKVNTEVSGNDLIISAGELIGTYEIPERDLGYIATFKIGILFVVSQDDDAQWDSFGEDTFEDLSDDYRFTGSEAGDVASFEIRTSEDNITWTDWEAWSPVDYTCRYFQLRMTLIRENLSQNIICSEFSYFADLPDVDDKLTGEVTVANDGADVIFVKEFHEVYGVHVTITTGTGVFYKISSLDLTGCNVKLYDTSGTLVVGEFLVHVHGI